MEQRKIDRINELARLAKQRALTAEELAERDTLRKEYIEDWRRSTSPCWRTPISLSLIHI